MIPNLIHYFFFYFFNLQYLCEGYQYSFDYLTPIDYLKSESGLTQFNSISKHKIYSNQRFFNNNNNKPRYSLLKSLELSLLVNLELEPNDYLIKDQLYEKSLDCWIFHIKQTNCNLPIFNADLQVVINNVGKVTRLIGNVYKGSKGECFKKSKVINVKSLLEIFLNEINEQSNLINILELPLIEVGYYLTTNNNIIPCYSFDYNIKKHWYHVIMKINENNEILSIIDWNHSFNYMVYPLGINSPNLGKRKLLNSPFNNKASPLGWHKLWDGRQFNSTLGNNVIVVDGTNSNLKYVEGIKKDVIEKYLPYTLSSNNFDNFNYSLDLTKEPTNYNKASMTQLFYITNLLHDIYYDYGFTEEFGNFQYSNKPNQGLDKDPLVAISQSSSMLNNADFVTPPDGKPPRMRLYNWDSTSPNRDSAMEQDIIIHEYTHGLSLRLTGGPSNSNCLAFGEAGGMGEGWGDVMAMLLLLDNNSTKKDNIGLGCYVNGDTCIRRYLYSTDKKINPHTYKSIDTNGYWGVHDKGEVWAVILYEVIWSILDKYPLSTSYFPSFYSNTLSSSLPPGNQLLLHLFITTLKFQPCRPTFIQTRDTMLQVSATLYPNSDIICLLWRGFAKRGLGLEASLEDGTPWGGGFRTESYKVPNECILDL